MPPPKTNCCILNGGGGSWAFEPLARLLSAALGIPISAEPREFNYLLSTDSIPDGLAPRVFIPLPALHLASDKRLLAATFERHGVTTPQTVLCESFTAVREFLAAHTDREWCLKYPVGCGANGHRFISIDSSEPARWPRPFVVQEFIRMARPEVYRLYGAGEEIFGWVARRFLPDRQPSSWVAHARGARYERAGEAPPDAVHAARRALQASGLIDFFGCVDLLRRSSGEWVVLEVGTDGLYNHVDRELGDAELEGEISRRIADAFWRKAPR
jgi:glutathione synthase/RimK-type ligase-like ATP-grasp enzyme